VYFHGTFDVILSSTFFLAAPLFFSLKDDRRVRSMVGYDAWRLVSALFC